MDHWLRVVPCSLLALLVASLAFAPPAGAGTIIYDGIPDAITITPDGSFPVSVVVLTTNGPVNGAYVEIEFSPVATELIAWTDPLPPGADAPTIGPGGGYLFSGNTDPNGEVVFHIAGGGCVAGKNPQLDVQPYVTQIRADNILLAEPIVNSPDAVDYGGVLPEDLGANICDPLSSTTLVGLADALFHTPAIKQGAQEICTDFTKDHDPAINLGDASILTPYVVAGTTGSCVYAGP